MRVDAKADKIKNHVLVDEGTGKRIPFACWCDLDTGEYEAFKCTPDGKSLLADGPGIHPTKYRGKAVGKLKLVPMDQAWQPPPPKPGPTAEAKAAGLEIYKTVYFEVFQQRGEPKRAINDRWLHYLKHANFLDSYVIRK